ncbi:hypothetical protein NL676_019360 [Syzygium grande]|nr:hypothetical protein NL676_019360 [Syzygium grande]
MDRRKSTSHIVLPIFYKVDPSNVTEGQRALREVSDLRGWESEKVANGHEGELVEKIKKKVLSELRQDFQLDVSKHLVGIGDHVNKIRNWVDTPTTNARMIGIYGMGGIGKTTLAKVVATSGDSSNELLSEIRWLQWNVFKEGDRPLPMTNLHIPNLSVLELSESVMTKDQEEGSLMTPAERLQVHKWCFGLRYTCDFSDLSYSHIITEDWEGWSLITPAERLQVLDLSGCNGLRCTPDLSAFTQLKVLRLDHCAGLEHLHPSVGKLKSLISLELSFCFSLKELPEEVCELKELEELVLDGSGITEIPPSIISSLKKLKTLSAYHCQLLREIPSSIGDLRNLQHLNLSDSGIEKLPNATGDLSSLQHLDLWRCDKLRSLPRLSSLIHLEELHLLGCHLLEDIPELPSRLLILRIEKCGKLILLELNGLKTLEELSLKSFCRMQTDSSLRGKNENINKGKQELPGEASATAEDPLCANLEDASGSTGSCPMRLYSNDITLELMRLCRGRLKLHLMKLGESPQTPRVGDMGKNELC